MPATNPVESHLAPVMTAKQIQAFEQRIFETTDQTVVMQQAGQAVFDTICQYYPLHRRWQVFCGHGNNAGDGWVVATLAQAAGIEVSVVMVGTTDKYSACTQQKYQTALALGVKWVAWSEWQQDDSVDLVVDALLGTGVQDAPRTPFDQAIVAINQLMAVTVAIDLPSGLPADTGWPKGAVIEAQLTVSMIAHKRGAVSGQGRRYLGQYVLAELTDIDVDLDLADQFWWLPPDWQVLDSLLPELAVTAHKGLQGHVLVVGGDQGMAGAVILAAVAALRAGAGKVTVATLPEHHASVVSYCPSLMTTSPLVASGAFGDYDVVLIGPGTRDDSYLHGLVQHYRHFPGKLVIDAGALALAAPTTWQASEITITPHPGEAARILDVTTEVIEADRYAALVALKKRVKAAVILKGSGTLIGFQHQNKGYVCGAGNPGMATAGSGDVLAGMCAGLWAQSLTTQTAVIAATLWHSLAADQAAKRTGQRAQVAVDLLAELARSVR